MPSTPPKSEMTSDSSRTIRLTPLRSRPIARSMPISCERSKTDIARVLTTPSTATITAIASRP